MHLCSKVREVPPPSVPGDHFGLTLLSLCQQMKDGACQAMGLWKPRDWALSHWWPHAQPGPMIDAGEGDGNERGQYLTHFLSPMFTSLQHRWPCRGHESLGLAHFCGCFSSLSHLLGQCYIKMSLDLLTRDVSKLAKAGDKLCSPRSPAPNPQWRYMAAVPRQQHSPSPHRSRRGPAGLDLGDKNAAAYIYFA